MAETSIGISEEGKAKLDGIKLLPRETYEEVITRIIRNNKLYRRFIDETNQAVKWEQWFSKQKVE